MIGVSQGHFPYLQPWPTALFVAAVAVAALGWVALCRLQRRLADGAEPPVKILAGVHGPGLRASRALLGFAGVWAGFVVLDRMILLATNWPLWPIALTAAVAGEALLWLYDLERLTVSRRTGLTLAALRLALLALVILMLTQPVLAWAWSENPKRTLAILVDTSASMRIADPQRPAHGKLRLAEALGLPAARRPYRLERGADALSAVHDGLMGELAWMNRLAQGKPDTAHAQLKKRRRVLHDGLVAAAKAVAQQIDAVAAVLSEFTTLAPPLRTALLDAKAKLSTRAAGQLKDAVAWLDKDAESKLPARFDRLRRALGRAAAALAQAAPVLRRVGEDLDTLLYRQLAPPDRQAVDALAAMSRVDLAKALLLHPTRNPDNADDDPESLIKRLAERYDVKVYTFSGVLAEADATGWTDPVGEAGGPTSATAPATGPTTAPATDADPGAGEPDAQRTDLAGAIKKVLRDVGGGQLAGILALTDGQDNGQGQTESLARALGGQGAAFCAAVFGDDKPPTDAAIISIEAPETVYLADRMYINAELKLDGLSGKKVRVALYDGDRLVDSETVRVAGDVHRTRVQLADEPKTIGMHPYRVEIDPCHGEVFKANNTYALTLSVTDDKTKLLLIDGRPRWEFRYLKNLFTGRDRTVRLQYLLTDPDRYHGQPKAPPRPASAKRPAGQEEANALPADEAEWLKFDVVILGNVPRKALDDKAIGAIKRFVSDRGGTLIAIAGPDHMPGAYAGTPLAELLPVVLPKSPTTAPSAPAARRLPAKGFRIALTPAGRRHVIFRQDVEPEKSAKVWASLPAIYWHSRYGQASPAGEVLAYARLPDAPKWLTQDPGGPRTTSAENELTRKREAYRRHHALVTTTTHGLGKVMLLHFDRTWRLRYRVGDTHHHKFWGQVLRWATAGKLPAGTHLVRLGTDKTRYTPKARPIARAKIVRADFAPVVTDQVAVKVFEKDHPKPIGRFPMKYLKDSPGVYTATLDVLPAGSYRVELDAPEADKLLAKDGVKTLSAAFSVDPSSPTEQIELAGNRHLMSRLASLSHQGAAGPCWQVREIVKALPAEAVKRQHRRQFDLWDSWPLLALFCLAAAGEWILRKRAGLA